MAKNGYHEGPPDSVPSSTHAPKNWGLNKDKGGSRPIPNPGGNQPHGRKGYGTMATVNKPGK